LGGKPHSIWHFFFSLSPCQKNHDRKKSNLLKTPFGRRKKDNINSTTFDRTECMRTSLPPMDNSLPFQLLKYNYNLFLTIFYSAFINLRMLIGIPKYLIGNSTWLHPNNSPYNKEWSWASPKQYNSLLWKLFFKTRELLKSQKFPSHVP
jgi:hypothetical protein